MSYTSNTPGAALTLEKLKQVMQELAKPDPLAEWMKSQGCNPELGWVLVLPKAMEKEWPFNPPYLRFNTAIKNPSFALTGGGLNLYNWKMPYWPEEHK